MHRSASVFLFYQFETCQIKPFTLFTPFTVLRKSSFPTWATINVLFYQEATRFCLKRGAFSWRVSSSPASWHTKTQLQCYSLFYSDWWSLIQIILSQASLISLWSPTTCLSWPTYLWASAVWPTALRSQSASSGCRTVFLSTSWRTPWPCHPPHSTSQVSTHSALNIDPWSINTTETGTISLFSPKIWMMKTELKARDT